MSSATQFVTRLFGALAFLLPPAAIAADFQSAGVNSPFCEKVSGEDFCIGLALQQEIKTGDSIKLSEWIRKIESGFPPDRRARVGVVHLNSSGGNVAESMKIGRILRSKQIATVVTADSVCASSCVLILAAGVDRSAMGPVVVHSFYSPEFLGSGDFVKASEKYDEVARTIETYLQEMRVPRALLDEMIKVPHYSSKQLTRQEVFSLGLWGIDPAYAQSRRKQP